MCDMSLVSTVTRKFCLARQNNECSSLERCPNAQDHKHGGVHTKLCAVHAEMCMHCGKIFCQSCLEVHQPACPRRPDGGGFWEIVERVFDARS